MNNEFLALVKAAMTESIQAYDTRLKRLEEQVSQLNAGYALARVDALERKIEQSRATRYSQLADEWHASWFTPGTRVQFRRSTPPSWTGVVIPRPAGYDPLSSVSRRPLVFVMRDDDHAIRGCFPQNLRRI